jgi:ABC-type antimicrobial peptide transport system permease subunit
MREHLGLALLPARAGGYVLGLFGLVGMTLASLGVWGLVAYSVRQREREIGVRMALGAGARDVERLVVGEALRPVGLGLAAGLPVAAGAAQLLSSFLYGVSPLDPVTFVGVPLALAAAALLASAVPARQATRIDPIQALRSE